MKTEFFENAERPKIFDEFMDPNDVAEKIIDNLKSDEPQEELLLKRPVK